MGCCVAHIVVVEDDEQSRRLLRVALERAGHAVTDLANGRHVLAEVERNAAELVLLDLRLGDGPDGIDIARSVRAVSDVPIMFLSAVTGLEERLEAFGIGSDDFLTKPVSVAELLARIDAVLRRTIPSRRHGVLAVDDVVVRVGQGATRGGVDLRLTKTELNLLTELVRRPGRVVSKHDLLARAWGYTEFDPNVVEVAMSALRKKLEAHGPRLIHTVRGAGYIMRPAHRSADHER